jgi:hypothetical protein
MVKWFRYTPWSRLEGEVVEVGEWSASRPGRPLPPGKEPPVPIVQEAGWATAQVWKKKTGEKPVCLCRGSNPFRPVPSQTLYRLSYPANKMYKGSGDYCMSSFSHSISRRTG